MSRPAEATALVERMHAFIDQQLAGQPTEDRWSLALDIHRYQVARDPVTRALAHPEPERIEDLPAVPVDLFKRLAVGTVPDGEEGVTFLTSGTTQGVRGAHRLYDATLYEHAALAWFRRCVPDAPARWVGVLSDPTTSPESSLSHMVAHFGCTSWHFGPDGVDVPGLAAALAEGPCFVGTTAFALAEWLSHQPAPLPPGSMVMVTGGFKGRVHKLDHDELYEQTVALLRPARVVTEYGMTELSSQLWGTPEGPYAPPPWLVVVAVDPDGTPLGPDQVGQLRFYDLANVDSTLGIETADLGQVHPDGTVTLHGRLSDHPDRGCSLTVEESWLKGQR